MVVCCTDRNNADQELDAESAQGLKDIQREDAEIDAGVDEISSAIDRMGALASQMKEEVGHCAFLMLEKLVFISFISSLLCRLNRTIRSWIEWKHPCKMLVRNSLL